MIINKISKFITLDKDNRKVEFLFNTKEDAESYYDQLKIFSLKFHRDINRFATFMITMMIVLSILLWKLNKIFSATALFMIIVILIGRYEAINGSLFKKGECQ